MTTGFFISEYIEGASNNKALELYNNTGTTLDLSNYYVGLISNGGTDIESVVNLSGTLNAGETFVLANTNANAAIQAETDLISGVMNHNGDDHLFLLFGGDDLATGTVLDFVGAPAVGGTFADPGTQWENNGNETQNQTLIRNPDIGFGSTDGFGAGLTKLGTDWTELASDTVSDLGSHTITAAPPTGPTSLTVALDQSDISENGGTATVTVTLDVATQADLQVDLTSSDLSEGTLPASITISGGQSSATATFTAVDDVIADGTQTVTVSAVAGSLSGTATIDVTDDEQSGPTSLTVSFDESAISENGGAAIVTVTVDSAPATDLTVNLSSDDLGEGVVDTVTTILAGQLSAVANFGAVDDALVDGTQTVTVTATAGALSDTATIDVTDDDGAAVPVGLFFSEYIEGSSNNKAVEIYNASGAVVDLGDYAIGRISNGGTDIEGSLELTGVLNPGEVFVISSTNADQAILDKADATTGVLNYNGDDHVFLLTGGRTFADGAQIVDLIGAPAVGGTYLDPGSSWTNGGNSTVNTTLRRDGGITEGSTDGFASDLSKLASDWTSFPIDSFDDLGSHTLTGPQVVINEFSASTGGTDIEYIELFAAPGTDLSNFSVIQLEGSPLSDLGEIDSVTSGFGVADANGFSLASLTSNTLENGSLTLFLVEGFTGPTDADLDGDDDGVLDTTPWTRIVDSVGVLYNTTDTVYSETVLDQFFDDTRVSTTFAPGAASRITDGTDTDSASDWFRNDFSPSNSSVAVGEAFNTPGATNTIQTGTATFTIQDGSAVEGDFFSETAEITVLLNGAIGDGTQSVDFTVADGTATSGSDYNATSGTLTFGVGETSKTISIDVLGDTLIEGNEDLTVTLSNGVGATVSPTFGAASFEIIDDDQPVVVTPTLISAIQGSAEASPLDGNIVTVEAIVVGDFQNGDADEGRNLRGFFLQEEDADADADASTSEGLFVFDGPSPLLDVNVGDLVQVTGTVDEFFSSTQLTSITDVTILSSGNTLPTAAEIALPAVGTSLDSDGNIIPDLEAFEGMLVSFTDTMTITEMFQLDRYNEIKLVQGDRPYQFTQLNEPDVAGFAEFQQDLGARTITYDDGLNQSNQPVGNLDGFGPVFSTASAIRMGDTIDGLSGVLDYNWAGDQFSDTTWRLRSTTDGENTFTSGGDRPETPDPVNGELKVVSLNVLNYFTTLDDGGTTANGSDPRGADNQTEFDRQTEKLVTAITTMDADILGLVELENDFLAGSSGNAIENLVAELNAATAPGTYAWANPGTQFVGDDAIATGFIYNATTVGIAAGTSVEVLDDSDLAALGITPTGNGIFSNGGPGQGVNRPAVAVTFEELATGGTFTAAVNHFKSKGSLNETGIGNEDAGDGAGRNNGIRTEASIALAAWLATDPTGSGDDDVMILGDLNAYAMEDPITTLINAGFTDLVQEVIGPDAYGYVFDGQVGTLDYAMANDALFDQVNGVVEWQVNSDEPDAIDYNTDFGRDQSMFDGSAPARHSDHDPVLLGLDLDYEVVEVDGPDDFGWDTVTSTFSRDGTLKSLERLFDNGRLVETEFEEGQRVSRTVTDLEDNFSYAQIFITYDENGNEASRGRLADPDDGRLVLTEFENGVRSMTTVLDLEDTFQFTSILRTFDENGDLSESVTIYDDGREMVTTYDAGVNVQRIYTDVDDNYDWFQRIINYDANGDRLGPTIEVPDDIPLL